MNNILEIKSKIFGTEFKQEVFTNFPQKDEYLEEILNSLTNKEHTKDFIVFNALETKIKSIKQAEEQSLWIDDKKVNETKMVLYQLSDNLYYVYTRRKSREVFTNISPKIPKDPELEHKYGLFVPSGVIIRRVAQNILGTGVLGRAFLGMNYIEILDSLSGNAYQEVLTHEVLHIIHPQKKEREIRHMTRNYIGPKNTVYH